jgi:hypothetical protein
MVAEDWTQFSGADADWDALVASLPHGNVFQSSAWAAHKRDFGWTTVRVAAGRSAAAQFMMKSFPGGTRLLWGRGGPVGDHARLDGGMRRAVSAAAGGLAKYVRFCSYRELTTAQQLALNAAGWKRPDKPLNKNTTFVLDLTPDTAALEKGFSSNWGHNLRRGLKRAAIRLWEKPQAAELAEVYRSMEGYKGLKAQHGELELASLIDRLGDRMVLYRADGPDGKAVSLRACALDAKKGWDLLAANSEAGRKSYASYALLWALLSECKKRGALEYDLGGADAEGARGVYDFKKGTGARPLEYLGEWDWAEPSWARAAMGAAVAFKAAA